MNRPPRSQLWTLNTSPMPLKHFRIFVHETFMIYNIYGDENVEGFSYKLLDEYSQRENGGSPESSDAKKWTEHSNEWKAVL